MTQIRHEAFKQGVSAYRRGAKLDENPYTLLERPDVSGRQKVENSNHKNWLMGWSNTKAEEMLHPRRKQLDETQRKNPTLNLSQDWLGLAAQYKEIEYEANYQHCMFMYRKNMNSLKLPIPAEYAEKLSETTVSRIEDKQVHDWMNRKDMK